MPTTNPLILAVRDAERDYSRFDRHRDRERLRRKVTHLDKAGHSSAEIAVNVGMDASQVRRITRGAVDPTHRPDPVNPPDMSDGHCRQLERTADMVLELACRLRDEDPQIIWDTLRNLGRGDLQELAVIALAAIPVDKPKTEVFAWVYQIGENL